MMNRILYVLLVVSLVAARATPLCAREYAPRVVSEHTADAYSMKTFAQFHRWRNDERGVLADIYCDIRTSADELSQSPMALRELTKKFNRRARLKLSGERLLSELLRMRKQGQLPSVRVGA